eukprot:2886244-Amphidinium_carterae.1
MVRVATCACDATYVTTLHLQCRRLMVDGAGTTCRLHTQHVSRCLSDSEGSYVDTTHKSTINSYSVCTLKWTS